MDDGQEGKQRDQDLGLVLVQSPSGFKSLKVTWPSPLPLCGKMHRCRRASWSLTSSFLNQVAMVLSVPRQPGRVGSLVPSLRVCSAKLQASLSTKFGLGVCLGFTSCLFLAGSHVCTSPLVRARWSRTLRVPFYLLIYWLHWVFAAARGLSLVGGVGLLTA